MHKLVMFGAGNIGRSFIAQLFSRGGYETVFIDINKSVIDALNTYREYPVEIRDTNPAQIIVKNVRGVHTQNAERVAEEIATADIAATAVGPNNLQYIYPLIAAGLLSRARDESAGALDIIICENLRNASDIMRAELKKLLPAGFKAGCFPGLIETSIGKMVPLQTHSGGSDTILTVFAEAYNTLILDAKGFRGEIPDIPGLEPKTNMKAYVDRKLFIHNLGHSLTAYLGHLKNPSFRYIYEAIGDSDVQAFVRAAMEEARDALIAEYPDEFTVNNLNEHIDDLITRFANKSLGDTIYRVGRDLKRKLSAEERLTGALHLELKHSLPYLHTLSGIGAALHFEAADDDGKTFPGDGEVLRLLKSRGIGHVLHAVSGFHGGKEQTIEKTIEKAHNLLAEYKRSSPPAGLEKIISIFETI